MRLASYFDPLRFFLPAAIGLFMLGVLRGIRDVIVVNQFGALSVILLLTSFQVFVLGVIADVIVRRFLVVPSAPQRPETGKYVTDAGVAANRLPQQLPSATQDLQIHVRPDE